MHEFQDNIGHGGRRNKNQAPHECKEKVLANELLHTIMYISDVVHQI